MGLAASQARLLTITSRKSRAQFENMRMSHQKLALSRNLTDISNEYQKSLNQTNLYYDFYGINSTDTPLTYDMLMSPSSINDYTPTLITNNQSQVVLSAPYAGAARAAGIPMEGLGCQPSSVMRDAFIQALAAQGIITQNTADIISAVDYNQLAGLGADKFNSSITTTGDYDALMEMLDNAGGVGTIITSTHGGIQVMEQNSYNAITCFNGTDHSFAWGNTGNGRDVNTITLKTLLDSREKHIYIGISHAEGGTDQLYNAVQGICEQLGSTLSSSMPGADLAVQYADMKMREAFGSSTNDYIDGNSYDRGKDDDSFDVVEYGSDKFHVINQVGAAVGAAGAVGAVALAFLVSNPIGWIASGALALVGGVVAAWDWAFGDVNNDDCAKASMEASQTYLVCEEAWGKTGWARIGDPDPDRQASLDLSAFVQAWFTYFMQYMYGLGSAESNDLSVKWGGVKSQSNFVDKEDCKYQFTFSQGHVSDNEALISNFYDTLFNQICMNGWTENNQVAEDKNYLKEMLQSGMMYVTSMSDDYFYYQNNYSTNSFIKEVADEAAIAAAESKYTTEKARINAKEQELDLKMKNLDTEISSLETEYEAVKKVIEGNVSKSFTRYDG